MTIGFAENGAKRNGMTDIIMKLLSILTLSVFMAGCAACKSGQVKLGGECLWPGKTYTTSLNGDVIHD